MKVTTEFLNTATNTIANKQILYNKILDKLNSIKNPSAIKFFKKDLFLLGWEWASFLRHERNQKILTKEHLIPLNENFFVQSYIYKPVLIFLKNEETIVPMVKNITTGEIQELDVRRNHINTFKEAYKKYVMHGLNPLKQLREKKEISNQIINTYGVNKYNITFLKNGNIRFDETQKIIETNNKISVLLNSIYLTKDGGLSSYKNNQITYFHNMENDTSFLIGKNILSTNNKEEFKIEMTNMVKNETEKRFYNFVEATF